MEITEGPSNSEVSRLPPEYRLHRACWHGNISEVKALLQQGCAPNFSVAGKSCLRAAMEKGNVEVGWQLLHHGANPNEVSGRQRNSLLHIAAKTGNCGFATLLMENGANPNATNAVHQAPLHLASRGGFAYLVDDLLKHGALSDVRDSLGNTPLHIAAKAGHTEVCKTLLKQGSFVDSTNSKGNTPYQSARLAGNAAAAEMLVAYGAAESKSDQPSTIANPTSMSHLAARQYKERTL